MLVTARHGVIHAKRTAGNQRRFDETAACRIRVAKLAQRVGLTVREIAGLFSVLPADPETKDWGRVTDYLVAEAENRVAQLKTQLRALESDAKLCEMGGDLDIADR